MASLSMLTLTLCLILAGYLSSLDALPTGADDMIDAVKYMNDYLENKVQTDNIEENMQATIELYQKMNASRDSLDVKQKRTLRLVDDMSYIKEIFDSSNKCGQLSYIALSTLNRYTNGVLQKENPVGRVEKLGRYYVKQHATDCGPHYSTRLSDRMTDLSSTTMDRIAAYLSIGITFVEPQIHYLMDESVTGSELRFNVAQGADQQAYNALVKVTSNYRNDTEVLHHPAQVDDIGEIYQRYFLTSCEILYQKIADVALPAIFDIEAVTHEEMPEIFKKFINCKARQSFDHSALVRKIAEIARRS